MKRIFFAVIIFSIFFFPYVINAQQFKPIEKDFSITPPGGIGVGDTTDVTKGTAAEKLVENIVSNVLNLLFTIGGIGVVIYFVWGAVDWILSGGDKEKVANARKKMTHALIGLALLSLSFVIINLVGTIVGFNPLGNLQLRDLGTSGSQYMIKN